MSIRLAMAMAVTALCAAALAWLFVPETVPDSAIRDWIASVEAEPAGRVEPMPATIPYETEVFRTGPGTRDPFVPSIARPPRRP